MGELILETSCVAWFPQLITVYCVPILQRLDLWLTKRAVLSCSYCQRKNEATGGNESVHVPDCGKLIVNTGIR